MNRHEWKDESACMDYDTNLFFEKYEDDELLRPAIDKICSTCPVNKTCFAVGITMKEWGVWGGVYLEDGQISKKINSHKDKAAWANTWQFLTMEQ